MKHDYDVLPGAFYVLVLALLAAALGALLLLR